MADGDLLGHLAAAPAAGRARSAGWPGSGGSAVHCAAVSAVWLKLPPASIPATTLSWLPRTVQNLAGQAAHRLDHLVGGGAVADQVAEHQHGVEVLAPGAAQDGLEGVPVGVHVGEDQDSAPSSQRAAGDPRRDLGRGLRVRRRRPSGRRGGRPAAARGRARGPASRPGTAAGPPCPARRSAPTRASRSAG